MTDFETELLALLRRLADDNTPHDGHAMDEFMLTIKEHMEKQAQLTEEVRSKDQAFHEEQRTQSKAHREHTQAILDDVVRRLESLENWTIGQVKPQFPQ